MKKTQTAAARVYDWVKPHARKVKPLLALRNALRPGPPKPIQERTRNFYRHLFKKGDLCFDIGANVGERTEVMLNLGARVVAIEPQAESLQQLKTKFAKFPTFSVRAVAIGSREGEVTLHISKASQLTTINEEWMGRIQQSGRFAAHPWEEKRTVPLITLESLIEQEGVPRFCKIDAEGSELDILSALKTRIPVLCFEFAFPEWTDRTIQCLQRLEAIGGYEFNFYFEDSFQWESRKWFTASSLTEHIRSLPRAPQWGDIYARQR